jgi:hypothetical protein
MIVKIQNKIFLGKIKRREREKFYLNIYFRYLNDLYALEYKTNSCAWETPMIRSAPPPERESHSCVFYRGQIENRPKLIVYGGMNGHRLGDLWSFHLGIKFIFLIFIFNNMNRFFTMDTNKSIWFGSSTT